MTVRRDLPVVLMFCLLTAVGQASVGPITDVRVGGGTVHIQATMASVSDVLDRLARTTGMKVVYEGARPTDHITAAIDASSETEALSRLFEGLGLTYAFKLDSTGEHVETLFVSSPVNHRASTETSRSTPGSAQMAPPPPEDYDLDAAPQEPQLAGNDPTLGGPPTPDGATTAANPGFASPGLGGAAGGAPGMEEQNPTLPSAASFPGPGGPTGPGAPTFPGPASYP